MRATRRARPNQPSHINAIVGALGSRAHIHNTRRHNKRPSQGDGAGLRDERMREMGNGAAGPGAGASVVDGPSAERLSQRPSYVRRDDRLDWLRPFWFFRFLVGFYRKIRNPTKPDFYKPYRTPIKPSWLVRFGIFGMVWKWTALAKGLQFLACKQAEA